MVVTRDSARAADVFVMISALLVLVAVAAVAEVAFGKTFGQYSLFVPDFAKARSTALKAKVAEGFVEEVKAKDRETDTHVFNIEVPDIVSDTLYEEIRIHEMEALSNRLMKADTVVKDKESKCSLSEDALVATFKSWTPFFGWTTYSMVRNEGISSTSTDKKSQKRKRKKGEEVEELVIKTSSLETDRDAQCVVLFKALLREDRTIQLVIECDTSRIPKKQRKVLLSKLREMWRERVVNALIVASTRIKQKKNYDSEGAETLKRIKERALDKTINPEKYKSTSPTVRRTGSNGGRYDPSQGARERASSKRKTQVVRRGG